MGSACGTLRFEVGQDLPEQRVPGSPVGGLLPSFVPSPIPLTIDLRAETERRNTGPARSVQLSSLVLHATPQEAPSGTFDFLDEVRIYIAARDGSRPRVEIARLVSVPRGQVRLELTVVPEVELLPYLNAGAEITATARGTQPRRDVTFAGRIELTVRV
ncbi:MAG: hypothetical protein RMK29_13530 [Myxococcales bacterium]|nr:hypothetical protein [Myxococcota bacterium]MDW8282729.1 hypothetical protein [Myxococcales bacterium]